jgi:hypothetical protein
MIGFASTDLRARAALAAQTATGLCAAGALALWIGCASDAASPPPALEVLRTTAEDGSVSYTLRRNRPMEGTAAQPDGTEAPAGSEAPSSDGERSRPDDSGGPGDQVRNQLESDREFLRGLISRQAPAGFERSQDPRLRAIAERLPRLQAELEALENEPEP